MSRDKGIEDMRINERWKARALKAEAQLNEVHEVRAYCMDYPQYHKTVLKYVVEKLNEALEQKP